MLAWKWIFALAAVFTLGAGLPSLVAPAADAMGLGYADTPQSHLLARFVGLLITVFGVGYVILARNPLANRSLALLGVIGKSGACALLTYAYLNGVIPLTPFLLGLGDIVFVILFAIFLWKTRRADAPATAATSAEA